MASNNMSPLRNFLNSIKNSVYNISIDGINSVDKNASSLFYNFPNLYRAISLNDMNYITDMRLLFFNTRKLSQIPNYNFNTSNVTDMFSMFYDCDNLINIPNFNTSSVTDMSRMFIGCYNLTTVSNLDTSNVKNMSYMFLQCNNLSQASVNNIVASCSTATKVTNKNWTNIGFNVAEGSQWNTWIRTAPNYMNAVNIGWQNIGDAILPAYKRRIMIGDDITGLNLWWDTFPNNYALNIKNYIETNHDNYWTAVHAWATNNSTATSLWGRLSEPSSNLYTIDYSEAIGEMSEYIYNGVISGNTVINSVQATPPLKLYSFRNFIVDEVSNDELYRHFYIEDENIRPLEEGDVIGPGTKFYFTFPDNLSEFIPNTYAPDITEEILILQAQQTNKTENFYSIIFSIDYVYHLKSIHIETVDKDIVIFDTIGNENNINDSFYTVTNEYIAKVTEYNNFDFWSKYILVDTRTLYRNVKIGDNLRNRTFYFTFPDDMYNSNNFTSAFGCEEPYFGFLTSKFTHENSLVAYTYPDWNYDILLLCYFDEEYNRWTSYAQPHLYMYNESNLESNATIWKTVSNQDIIVTSITETSDVYKNTFIREQENELTLEEQALNLARLYYFDINRPASANFSVATTRGEDVFVIQATNNAVVQMWLTVNTTLGVVLEGSSNPTNEDYALALAEKYYKENYGNDTVYYGVATQKSETEFVIQVTQNAAVLMFLNVNVSTGEVTER